VLREVANRTGRALRCEGKPTMFVLIGSHTEPNLGGVFNGVGRGVYCALVHPASGKLDVVDHFAVSDPTYIAVSHERSIAYAASHSVLFKGWPGSGVTALAISPEGRLSPINSVRLDRPHATMLSLDSEGDYLFVACSLGGGIYSLRLNSDGSIGDILSAAVFSGDVVVRQGEVPIPVQVPTSQGMVEPPMTVTRLPWYGPTTMPHAIVQTPDRNWLLVPDAGASKIYSLRFEPKTGQMQSRHFMELGRVTGPRGLALRDEGSLVYAVNEKNSTTTAIRLDRESGTLRELQTVSTLPSGWSEENTASGICISPDQRRLWVTNRGNNSVCTFGIDQDGLLEPIAWTETRGRFPMHISVSRDGTLMFVSNTFSRTVATFRIDANGIPELLEITKIPATCCIPLERK
jgi:6-phosphogluconolactonase